MGKNRSGSSARALVSAVLVAALVTAVGLALGGSRLDGTGSTVVAVPRLGPLGAAPGAAADAGIREHRDHGARVGAVTTAAVEEREHVADVSDTGVPARVLAAYRSAEATTAERDRDCHLPWSLLAGIGKVESGHASGGAVDRSGDTLRPILGPRLDGGPGIAAIHDTDDGRWDGDPVWDRAVGPMQFIPSSWAGHGADGSGDGDRDPNNVFDAALASGGYLCSGERDLRDGKDLRAAVFSYNHSDAYVDLVLRWAAAYASGVEILTGALTDALQAETSRPPRGSGPGASVTPAVDWPAPPSSRVSPVPGAQAPVPPADPVLPVGPTVAGSLPVESAGPGPAGGSTQRADEAPSSPQDRSASTPVTDPGQTEQQQPAREAPVATAPGSSTAPEPASGSTTTPSDGPAPAQPSEAAPVVAAPDKQGAAPGQVDAPAGTPCQDPGAPEAGAGQPAGDPVTVEAGPGPTAGTAPPVEGGGAATPGADGSPPATGGTTCPSPSDTSQPPSAAPSPTGGAG